MICEADFADVFPWMSDLEGRSAPNERPTMESEACIARWEDEGGAVLDNPRPAEAAASSMQRGDRSDATTGRTPFYIAPPIVTHAAASAMFGTRRGDKWLRGEKSAAR